MRVKRVMWIPIFCLCFVFLIVFVKQLFATEQSDRFHFGKLIGATCDIIESKTTNEILLRIYRKEELILVFRSAESRPSNPNTPCIEMAGWYVHTFRSVGNQPVIGDTMLAYIVVSPLQDFINMKLAPEQIKREFAGKCEVLRVFAPTDKNPRVFSDNDEMYIVRSVTWEPVGFIRGALLSIVKPCDEEVLKLLEFRRKVLESDKIDPSRLIKVLKFAYNKRMKTVKYLHTSVEEVTE